MVKRKSKQVVVQQEPTTKPSNGKYYVHKLQAEEFQNRGIPLRQNMLDQSLQNFMDNVKDESVIEKVTTKIIRLRDVDWLASVSQGQKRGRKDYLVFYQTWFGVSSDNNPIPQLDDIYFGQDAIISEQERFYGSDGKELPITNTNPRTRTVHTIEWNTEVVRDLVENSSRTGPDSIQFLVHSNRQSYGGYEYNDMITQDFDTLIKYGQYGKDKVLFGLDKT